VKLTNLETYPFQKKCRNLRNLETYPPQKNIETYEIDAIIIGAGIVGLAIACELSFGIVIKKTPFLMIEG